MNTAAAAATPHSERPHRPAGWLIRLNELRFFTVSLILHLILLIVLGSMALYQATNNTEDFESAGGGGLIADTTQLQAPSEQPAEAAPAESTTSSAPAPAASMSSLKMDALTSAGGSTSISVSGSNLSPALGGIGNGVSVTAGNGQGSGTGGVGLGMGRGTMRFFGTQASGSKIVIVVDVSGSMVRGKNKSGKTYGELEKEVIRVIREMDMKSGFGLIVFSADAKIYKPQLMRATSEEKERAISWLKRHNPTAIDDPKSSPEVKEFHHGTRADRGLAEAFLLTPDLIFFVSDGEPTGKRPPEILESVAEAQKQLPKPAEVHSVAYLADGGQRFMRELAQQNGGTFREVNPRDLD